MNATLVWQRILWKETRHLGLLAVGIIVICTALSGLAGVAAEFPGTTANLLWTLAIFVPGCYAFGCTAMLLSGEKEAGTWDWLRNAGVPRMHVLLAKAAFVLASSYAMQLVMLALALICTDLSRANPPPILRTDWPSYTGLITLHFAAVGWLACSLISRVIPATMTWLGLLMGLSFLFSLRAYPAQFYEFGHLVLSAVIVLVLAIDVAISSLWWRYEFPLRNVSDALWGTLGIARSGALQVGNLALRVRSTAIQGTRRLLPSLPAAWFDRIEFPTWRPRAKTNRLSTTEVYPFAEQRARQRLTWKSRRQLWQSIGMIVGAVVLAMLTVFLISPWDSNGTFLLGFTILPFVLGLLSFRDEQIQSRFRFYTDRGLSTRSLWWSIQYRWLLPVLILCGLAYLAFDVGYYRQLRAFQPTVTGYDAAYEQTWIWYYAASIASGLVACYAVGQWASQTFRTTFFALIGGIVLLVPVLVWCSVGLWLGVPVWLTGLPVALWLLAVTWWRMPAWCLELAGWKSMLQVCLAMSLPPLVLFFATCCYRAIEVDATSFAATQAGVDASRPKRPRTLNGTSSTFNSLIVDARLVERIESPNGALRIKEVATRFNRDFRPWLLACRAGTSSEALVLLNRPTPVLAVWRRHIAQRLEQEGDSDSLAIEYDEMIQVSTWLYRESFGLPDGALSLMELERALRLLPQVLLRANGSIARQTAVLENAAECLANLPPYSDPAIYWFLSDILSGVADNQPPTILLEDLAALLPSERVRAQNVIFQDLVELDALVSPQFKHSGTFHGLAQQYAAVTTAELTQLEIRQSLRRQSTPLIWGYRSEGPAATFLAVESLDNARGALLSAACVLFRKVHNRLPVDHAELMTFWKPDPRLDLEPGPSQKLQYFPHGLTAQQLGMDGQKEQHRPHWEGQPLWYASTRYSRDTEAHAIRYPQWQQYSRRSIGDVFPIPPLVEPVEPSADAAQPENPASDLVEPAVTPVP